MNRLLRPLLSLTAVLGVAAAGDARFLRRTGCTEQAPAPRAATPLVPVRVTDATAQLKFAVKPKEFSATVKKGLEYLVKAQQDDGGWNQGGGWRVGNGGGGRVEGKNVEDPSDIGNTSLALLALVRAGNTPTEGEYKDAVKKGLNFVIAKIAKVRQRLALHHRREGHAAAKQDRPVHRHLPRQPAARRAQRQVRRPGQGARRGARKDHDEDRQAPDGRRQLRQQRRLGAGAVGRHREQEHRPRQAERRGRGRTRAEARFRTVHRGEPDGTARPDGGRRLRHMRGRPGAAAKAYGVRRRRRSRRYRRRASAAAVSRGAAGSSAGRGPASATPA